MKIETIPSMAGDVMPPMVASLIARIKNAGDTEKFIQELDRARSFQTVLAKTELYRWAEVLNRCDDLLEEASTSVDFSMAVDTSEEVKFRTIAVLRFTSLLFECSSTRRVYSSTERLISLLDCTDLDVVAEVLRLLQTISKRSKYLTQRLGPRDQGKLVQVLTAIAQSWGGKLRSVKMTDCISKEIKVPSLFPLACADNKDLFCCTNNTNKLHENSPLLSIVNELCDGMSADHKYFALARLRVLKSFHNPDHRMKCLIVRLLSISTLIHCRCQTDESQFSAILYTGFIEETVALLRINLEEHPLIDTIQAEALRTLISIVSLDKQPMHRYRLNQILECLGASSYHGFLAVFTRTIVEYLQTNQLGKPGKPSVALGTSLFSFIYHLSSADTGGENLVACGLTQTLLTVLEYQDLCLEHISFATRCSRIIDIFTTIDVTMFNSCKGMNIFVERFVHEIDQCREDQPFTIDVTGDVDDETEKITFVKTPVVERRCHQQRSGLIKGLLTFLKRAIQEPTLQDSVRHIMEGGLPDALMHIISNAEYYSESIYHHALQMVTFFIYQEPSQLGFLQSKHLPYVILQSILRKELPGSRDVISNLGNVFTALCLNEVGLRQFKSYRPFDHVFKIVLSIKFIATMKKKRSEMNDAAQGIGQALEDLLRHQPTLKPLMVDSVFDVLDLLLKLGTTPPSNTKIVMALSKSASKAVGQSVSSSVIINSASGQQDYESAIAFSPRDEDMSDEDEDAELSMDEMSADRPPVIDNMGLEMDIPSENNDGSRILPLGDYLIIFSKILETIIGHSVSNEIMTSFVAKGGVNKLIMLTLLPSLSPDIVTTHFGHSIAVVIQQLLQYGESGQILMESFLNLFVARVPFAHPIQQVKGASLLIEEEKQIVVDSMCFINNCIPLLTQICKTTLGGGQYSNDRRNKMHEAFLTDPGKNLLIKIRKISRILAWESGLIKTIEPAKQVVSTQTDTSDLATDDNIEATPIPDSTDVVSVSCDTNDQVPPECEKYGIVAADVAHWRSNRSLGEAIVKANKNVSEFLNLLCRSCYIPTRRHRRYEYSSTPMPKSASQLADQLFSGAYREMKWEPLSSVESPMSFVVLHESLLQLNGVLFDERKYPYHAMIERFYSSGCHQAFCDMLIDKLAPALTNHKSPAFDDAILEWFRLAEKLACRQKMIQTNYRFHSNQGMPFDAEKYCKLVHNDFFRCLSVLFSNLSKDTVDLREYQALCEAAISVYREVAQSLVPNEETENNTGTNRHKIEEHARALNDMGFDRNLVTEALLVCSNPADATEWLIRHQQQQNAEGRPKPNQKEDEEEDFAAPIITPLRELNINKDVSVSQACIELMPLCKKLMEVGSDLVFSCADLVTGVIESLDGTWKENVLIRQIMGEEIVTMTKDAAASFQEKEVCVLSTRIHFVCLLFEHLAEDYIEALKTMDLVQNMLYLLNEVYLHFDKPHMPNLLLPPLVLWLDLYEKCSRTLKRRKLLEKIVPSKQLKWSYITDEESRYSTLRNKRWVPYCANYQQVLNKEFFRGRSQAILKKKDKEIVIDFTSMKQKEADNAKTKINMELPEGTEFTLDEVLAVEGESIWTSGELSDLMVQLIRLLHKGNIHHTAVHSILSFTARLTRDEACGAHFLQSGGVVAMLQLRSSSSPFTVALVSIILRQCIDNDDMCKGVYEKVVRQIVSSHNSNGSQYDTRDWHDTMRRMLPLAVRKPAVFVNTMHKCVKLTPINNGLGMQFISKSYKATTDTNSSMNHIVALLLKEIYQGEWENAEKQTLGRMLSRGTLLSLLAELAKTYNGIANTVAETKENGNSMLYLLLERYVDGHDKETMKSLRYLLCVIATGNHSPKAQESAISDLKSVLVNVSSNTSSTEDICTKVEELCNIVIDMSDTCPTSPQAAKNSHSYQIIKLFHKKKICNDLVKTITYLQLVQKESIDTINHVLRTLESLMKILNTHHNMSVPAASTSRNLTRMDILRPGVIELVQREDGQVDMMREQVALRTMEQQGFREALERLPAERNAEGAGNASQMDDVDVEGDSEGSVLDDIVVDDDNVRREEEEEDEDQEMRDVEDDDDDDEEDDEDDDDDDEEESEDEDEDGPQDTEQNITMPIQPDLTAEEEETEEGEEEEEDDDQDEFELDDEPSFEHNRDVEAIYDDLDRPVIMGIDDWNLFPPININRLREPRSRAVTGEQHHPLLVRPPPASDATPAFNTTNISGSMREFRSILSGHQLVLTRQNAIRRLGQASRNLQQALHPNAPILERIFSLPPSRDRPALLSFMGFEDPRPRVMGVIQTALERLTEAVDLLEPSSSRYIGLLVFELAASEAKKKFDEECKLDLKNKPATETKTEGASTETPSEVVVVAPPQSEEARSAWDENVENQDTSSTQPSSSEPMEATSTNGQDGDSSQADDVPLPSSAATVASSLEGEVDGDGERDDEDDREVDGDEEDGIPSFLMPLHIDGNAGFPVQAESSRPVEESSSSSDPVPQEPSNVPEELREILGDIVLPEGVDPHFLAALPEELRGEVIRDHERQRRAQRATEAPRPDEGERPLVDPIDQDFLAALPPELQEEILQQHERAVREAEDAVRRANAPIEPEMDGAAVIASLPNAERVQVLADMDESELQRLPQAMQDEARRARNHLQSLFEPRNVMRIHNLYVGGPLNSRRQPIFRRNPTYPPAGIGNYAGKTTTARAEAVQLLDREAILTICGLFLVDNRLNVGRLQKVIRMVCAHVASCDFVIWCLQAILDKASDASTDDEEFTSVCPSWLESITVPGIGHNERSVKISKDAKKVSINPLISDQVCRNVLDSLIQLAKQFPGNFLPASLRLQNPEVKDLWKYDQFWSMIQNPQMKLTAAKEVSETDSLKNSRLSQLTQHFKKKSFQRVSGLQDKMLKLLSSVIQTLPNDTMKSLNLEATSTAFEEELGTVIEILTQGICGAEGFSDGRALLTEAMRALSPSTSDFIYDKLVSAIDNVGMQLKPQINLLLSQLKDIESDELLETANASTEKGRVKSLRLQGESVVVDADTTGRLMVAASVCKELRLPSVMALTDKSGAQYRLLSSLHTLTKIRDAMRTLKEDRRKKREEELLLLKKKRLEEEKKKKKEKEEAKSEGKPEGETTETPAAASASPPKEVEEEPEETLVEDPAEKLRSLECLDARLSQRLSGLEDLWSLVSDCLNRLGKASDPHAVLALQPAAEAFFLVHAAYKNSTNENNQENPDTEKMIEFAEKHRDVLNQVLRQNSTSLSSGGPFAILTSFPKLLDFDVKRKYFRKELTKADGDREYRRSDINVPVRRSQLFSDSFRELFRLRPADWKKRFYIVFQGEEGQDAGGLLREWFSVITREIFNPNYALFITAPGDMVTYMINKASYINPEHLDYFKFVGRLIAKAIYDNKLLDCYFTRAFYKHILNLPVRYQDIESEDPAFFNSLEFLLKNPINDLALDLTFSLEVEEFGVRSIRDLKPDGSQIEVNDENKVEYVNLVCQMKMTGSIRKQLDAFLTGFYEIIPKDLISMFNEQELELLISGLPDIDIDDLANNTEYRSYSKTCPQIQWFWRALRSFEPEDRAKFLQFVTGTSKVPLQGFGSLEGMSGVQKFSVHLDSRGGDRLPAAHTCFNQLDLPQYDSYEKLRECLLLAIRECTEGFGFA